MIITAEELFGAGIRSDGKIVLISDIQDDAESAKAAIDNYKWRAQNYADYEQFPRYAVVKRYKMTIIGDLEVVE